MQEVSKVSQLADVSAEIRSDDGGVEMHIRCHRTDPPVGQLWRVNVPDSPRDGPTGPIQFSGWLGLLRALADALGDPEDGPRQP